MATNTSDFFTYSATAGTAKNLQKPQDGGDNNQWGNFINVDLDEIVAAVNALSDKIADANEKTLVDFTATTDAVNHVGITNAATGNPPEIASAGSDTNVDLTLTAKGTGDINLTPGTNGDVNIPASKGITFGDDGEKIEGDGTDLTIASSSEININSGTLDLSAQTVDVTLYDAVDALNFDSNTLSIDASNNRVGINDSSPEYRLDITGPGTADGSTLRLNDSASSAASYHLRLTRSSAEALIGIQGSIANDPFVIRRKSSGTGDFFIDTDGNAKIADGNLIIDTAGHGIDFSAQTSSTGTDAAIIAELLDHYEWGTYRVVLTPDSGSFTMDTGRDLLGFVKVGNICTVSGYARVSSSSGPSGQITFNLPFAASSMNEYANNFIGHAVPENLGNSPPSYYTSGDFHCFIDAAGATTAKIKRTAGGTAAGNWGGVANYFGTNTNVTISLTYITA